MAKLHKKMSGYILSCVNNSRTSGEPIVRHLEYEFPHQGYQNTKDAFMLGDKYLVAPVITKGATKREIQLPKGFVWKYVDGTLYQGGKCVVVDAPLSVLPYFEKISE